MSDYLETIYFRDEYSEESYPQKLCDYIVQKYIQPHFKTEFKGKKLLDVGSGKGNHLIGFSRRGLNVLGLDKRKECIEVLKDFDIRECDIESEKFPFNDNKFDIVFSKSVLEHVWNTDNFLSQIYRVLKPGGITLLMTPDWASQYKIYWDDYTHVKAWTRKGLQNALRIHGYDNVDSILFRQLPILWKFPILNLLANITTLLPHRLKWKDKKEENFRTWIRFSKEKMILAIGVKPNA